MNWETWRINTAKEGVGSEMIQNGRTDGHIPATVVVSCAQITQGRESLDVFADHSIII